MDGKVCLSLVRYFWSLLNLVGKPIWRSGTTNDLLSRHSSCIIYWAVLQRRAHSSLKDFLWNLANVHFLQDNPCRRPSHAWAHTCIHWYNSTRALRRWKSTGVDIESLATLLLDSQPRTPAIDAWFQAAGERGIGNGKHILCLILGNSKFKKILDWPDRVQHENGLALFLLMKTHFNNWSGSNKFFSCPN